ncbi:hypothetical protein [Sphaerimonospora mesophila]
MAEADSLMEVDVVMEADAAEIGAGAANVVGADLEADALEVVA